MSEAITIDDLTNGRRRGAMGRRKRKLNQRKALRRKLIDRYGLLCAICCYPMKRNADAAKDPEAITIDHRVPKARGGTDHIDNLQLAHRRCNQARNVTPWSGGPEAP